MSGSQRTRAIPMKPINRCRVAGALTFVIIGWISTSPALCRAATQSPNVVLVLTDDLGYGDFGCYGSRDIRTPHLDRLASEGVRLTDFYSNGPVCTPTRAGLISGRWQQRVGLEWAIGPGMKAPGLPASPNSLPQLLKN